MTRHIVLLTSAALACVMAGATGCSDEKEQRASVEFHVRGVGRCIERVRKNINDPPTFDGDGARAGSPHHAMRLATGGLGRALSGLPERIEKKATSRVEERKAAAEKAIEKFIELRPVLESLKYDKAEINAKLDELAELVRQAERE